MMLLMCAKTMLWMEVTWLILNLHNIKIYSGIYAEKYVLTWILLLLGIVSAIIWNVSTFGFHDHFTKVVSFRE